MTNAEKLLNALNEIDDSYLLEVDKRISTVRTRRRATFTSIAAVFVAIILVVVFIAKSGYTPSTQNNNDNILSTDNEFEYNTENNTGAIHQYDFDDNVDTDDFEHSGGCAGCSRGFTAVATNNMLYFEIPYDGIYRYTIGEKTELLVKEKSDSRCQYIVNDIGLYYSLDEKSIYTIPHNSNNPKLFFENNNHLIHMRVYNSTDLLLEINYSAEVFGHDKSIIVDGETGDIKTTVYESKSRYDGKLENELIEQGYSYEEAVNKAFTLDEYFADEIIYTIGDRTLKATPTSDRNSFGYCTYTLSENSNQLLQGGEILHELSPELVNKDYIIFKIGEHDIKDYMLAYDYYIARANGEDSKLKLSYSIPAQGNSDYLYHIDYFDYDDNIMYTDTRTGESSALMYQKDISYNNLYSDGKYIYIEKEDYSDSETKYTIECYEIVFDENGVPTDLKLIDENIIE